jgi:hypothetical protein
VTFNGLHGVIPQKTELFITIAVRTSVSTKSGFILWTVFLAILVLHGPNFRIIGLLVYAADPPNPKHKYYE